MYYSMFNGGMIVLIIIAISLTYAIISDAIIVIVTSLPHACTHTCMIYMHAYMIYYSMYFIPITYTPFCCTLLAIHLIIGGIPDSSGFKSCYNITTHLPIAFTQV